MKLIGDRPHLFRIVLLASTEGVFTTFPGYAEAWTLVSDRFAFSDIVRGAGEWNETFAGNTAVIDTQLIVCSWR